MLTYTDPYLGPLSTVEREEKAEADVDAIGTFPNTPIDWRDRLIVLRVYIMTCIDLMKADDDLFSTKLAAYRKEWEQTLRQAQQAQTVVAGDPVQSAFSVSILRA